MSPPEACHVQLPQQSRKLGVRVALVHVERKHSSLGRHVRPPLHRRGLLKSIFVLRCLALCPQSRKFYDHNLMLHGYTAFFASGDIVTTLLTSVVIPCQHLLCTLYTRNFADVYTLIYIVNYDLKLLMMFKHTTTCFTNWVQTQEHLLTPCVNYSPPPFHPHSYTIFFGWLSSSMSHSAPKPNATSP